MEMPRPAAEHQQLAKFAGQWTGTEKIHPSPCDPEGGPATATVSNRVALGGFVVIQDYEQKRGGVVSFTGHCVFGFEAETKQHFVMWFDSMGCSPQKFVGSFKGDTFTATNQSPQGHARCAWTLSSSRYTFKMEMSEDGKQWFTFMEGDYRKS